MPFFSRRARPTPPAPQPETVPMDVILRLGDGTLQTLAVNLPADTPLSNLLRTAAIVAFRDHDITAVRIEAVTRRASRPALALV